MKKMKMALVATATIIGLGGAVAFTRPTSGCGWNLENGAWKQRTKGTAPGQYSCNAAVNITCSFQDDHVTRCDKGTVTFHN